MSWSVLWSPRFESDLKRTPWRAASAIARSVLDFAVTGKGRLRRGYLANERRLYVGSYCVHLLVDVDTRTLTAMTVFRVD